MVVPFALLALICLFGLKIHKCAVATCLISWIFDQWIINATNQKLQKRSVRA